MDNSARGYWKRARDGNAKLIKRLRKYLSGAVSIAYALRRAPSGDVSP